MRTWCQRTLRPVRGIRVDDSAGTVTIRLTEPDADFLHKLAQPLASVVPARTPSRVAQEQAPPGTGPYRIASVARDEIRLVRNSHFRVWSSDVRPDGYADEIRFRAQARPTRARNQRSERWSRGTPIGSSSVGSPESE